MGALRDIEFFLADHNGCGGLQVRKCPPTSAVGYYLALNLLLRRGSASSGRVGTGVVQPRQGAPSSGAV